jgi:hypothetical protein
VKRYISTFSLVLVCVLLCPIVASSAVLDGKTVQYQYLFPTIATNYGNADNGNKLVGAGVEVANIVDARGTMDISDTNFYVDFTNDSSFTPATFNGFRITDIFAAIPAFQSVLINPATNMVGLTASRITWDDDHIWVNWESLVFDANTVVSLDLVVPEPASFALAALGLLSISWRRRQRT